MNFADLAKRFRIEQPEQFRIAETNPDETLGLTKEQGKDLLDHGIRRLKDLQERIYAEDRSSILIVLQAMDAAGKDGVVEHVMSGLNPQGCEVHSFKQPTDEELSHDFLWRTAKSVPQRGRIGIFNRSHYEEVLVVRVHPEYLIPQKLPPAPSGEELWQERYRSIRNFEDHLAANGTVVLKFFLNVSRDEQKKRFLARLDEPGKRWKFSAGDIAERKLWPKYMEAYEEAIRHTSTPQALWFVVPADQKWFTRLIVAAAMVDAMERLNPQFPKVEGEKLEQLLKCRATLEAEK